LFVYGELSYVINLFGKYVPKVFAPLAR